MNRALSWALLAVFFVVACSTDTGGPSDDPRLRDDDTAADAPADIPAETGVVATATGPDLFDAILPSEAMLNERVPDEEAARFAAEWTSEREAAKAAAEAAAALHPGPCMVTVDQAADGTVDEVLTYTWDDAGRLTSEQLSRAGVPTYLHTWSYDTLGYLVEELFDVLTEGTEFADSWLSWTYDGEGRVVATEQDWGNDGIVEYWETLTFDSAGRMTQHDIGNVGFAEDGSQLVSVTSETWAYDDFGNPTSYQRDDGGDGVFEYQELWSFDAAGHVLGHQVDWEGDGVIDSQDAWTYTLEGAVETITADSGADGIVENVQRTTRDEAGQPLVIDYDWDGNGNADSRQTYSYFAGGALHTQSEETFNPDGTCNYRFQVTYDEHGSMLKQSYDYGADGFVEEEYTGSYSYDAEGRRITEELVNRGGRTPPTRSIQTLDARGNVLSDEYDAGADGIIETRYTHTWDDAGRQLSSSQDSNGDGTPEYYDWFTYAGEQLASATYDWNGDGTVDNAQTWAYDDAGKLLAYTEDSNGDGVVDARTTWLYSGANLLRQEQDYGDDGTIDAVASWTYDAGGRWTGYGYDGNNDGVAEALTTVVYADGVVTTTADDPADGVPEWVTVDRVDAEGRVVSRTEDYAADGLIENAYEWAYDAAGNTVRAAVDYGADGMDQLQRWSYDAAGHVVENAAYNGPDGEGSTPYYHWVGTYEGDRLVAQQTDGDGDGVFEASETWSFDAAGQLIGHTFDLPGDEVDSIETWTWNEAGQILSFSVDYPAGAPGYTPYLENWTYDAGGQPLSHLVDSGVDGTMELTEVWSYGEAGELLEHTTNGPDGLVYSRETFTYDGAGFLATYSTDWNADGVADSTTSFQNDADGHPVRVQVDYPMNPGSVQRYLRTYDANGNVVLDEFDERADGTIEIRWTSTYTESGKLLTSQVDYGADGVIDGSATYVYDEHGNVLEYAAQGIYTGGKAGPGGVKKKAKKKRPGGSPSAPGIPSTYTPSGDPISVSYDYSCFQ